MLQEGRTALLVACWRGFLPIVIMLIKSGANTNAQDQVHVLYMTVYYMYVYNTIHTISLTSSSDPMLYRLVSVDVYMHDVCGHRRVLVV